MANGAPTLPNLGTMLGQLASPGAPVGPIPTTPYAQTTAAVPSNIAPVYQPPAITKQNPYQAAKAAQAKGQGQGQTGTGPFGGFPTYAQEIANKDFGIGSPQTGMNAMGLTPQMQQYLMALMMNPGALGAGRAQGGGGMPGLGGSSGGAGGIPGRDVSAGGFGGAPTM